MRIDNKLSEVQAAALDQLSLALNIAAMLHEFQNLLDYDVFSTCKPRKFISLTLVKRVLSQDS